MNKRSIGASYEDLACERLENEGMQILARNYRVRIGEIDIIAKDREELVFVEVKYRSSTEYGGAEYAISRQKQQKIRRVAQWYMAEQKIRMDAFCRFDAILIDADEVLHIKNAWQ
ncbi:MAG: YraN family protein [Parasporobacterium sp.]|nr:YraN family protein [Parasporobacterium sp.]